MSESGAILPKRLTGVKPRKQRKLTRAIKRSHVLALLPKTWKLPRYRHASYADQYATHALSLTLSASHRLRLSPDPRPPSSLIRQVLSAGEGAACPFGR